MPKSRQVRSSLAKPPRHPASLRHATIVNGTVHLSYPRCGPPLPRSPAPPCLATPCHASTCHDSKWDRPPELPLVQSSLVKPCHTVVKKVCSDGCCPGNIGLNIQGSISTEIQLNSIIVELHTDATIKPSEIYGHVLSSDSRKIIMLSFHNIVRDLSQRIVV